MDNKFKNEKNLLLRNKKVLVFGLGLNQGGVGSAKFFASEGAFVKVTDLKAKEILKPSLDLLKSFPEITYTLGEHKYEDIDWADLIIKNPSVKPGNPYMTYAHENNKEIETDMGIFLKFVKPDQIIGITGTKGKSTTSSLIYEVLKATGKKVVLAGNIGKSVLDIIPYVKPDTLIVLEISSFQLEAFEAHKISPKWAIITNITPDHLNYYETMEDYIQSKKIVGKYQSKTDYLFLRKNDQLTTQSDFLNGLKSKIIYFSKEDLPATFHPKLLGNHNLENIAAALSVAKTFGVKEKTALNILSKFRGIPFRMELVKTWHGVKIYNDTAATAPTAATMALKAFDSRSKNGSSLILICGGMNKNLDYKEFAETISQCAKAVYFIEGDIVDELIRNMTDKKISQGRFDNFEDLLLAIKKDIQSNPSLKKAKTILFSPGGTSFNLFQNEFDRGRKFNTAVEKVFGESTS